MKRDTLFRECIAEFIGVFVILFFGAGSVAALIFKGNYSSFWALSVMWGCAVTIAIYVAGGVSGAHLNPAVTISLSIFKGSSPKKIVPYIIAQTLGAFAGAALVYLLYIQYFATADRLKDTACIFFTFPQEGLSNLAACGVESCLTAVFMMIILAVIDDKNPAAPSAGIAAIMIGAGVAVIGGTFGAITGFALNPARDFGPRIFAILMGWDNVALPGPNGYFWVPIVGPISGAIIGAFIYQTFIHKTLIEKEKANGAS